MTRTLAMHPLLSRTHAQARHATYGTIARVSGPLVNADPITAHTDLANADAINGCVAYIKRGGAPFTKKVLRVHSCLQARSKRGSVRTEMGASASIYGILCVAPGASCGGRGSMRMCRRESRQRDVWHVLH